MVIDEQGAPRPSPRMLKIAGLIAVCIALAVVVLGLLTRASENGHLKTWTQAQAIPTVKFVHPQPPTGAQALTLPGNLAAFNDAQLYARVPGYVHGWYQDIGARVKKGQLLATIDTPELDQQIAQAQADLVSAQAGEKLSQTTANRWTGLLAADAVSKQETDEKVGDLTVKNALVKAAKANLDRLQAFEGLRPHRRAFRRGGHQPHCRHRSPGERRFGNRRIGAVHRRRCQHHPRLRPRAPD